MAVAIEFISLVIPVHIIRKKYPGGWEKFLKDQERALGLIAWYDDHLFRTGSMSPDGMHNLVEHFASLGFNPTIIRDGKTMWDELCVVEFLGSTLTCDWIDFVPRARAVYYKGTEIGPIIGRETFRCKDNKT